MEFDDIERILELMRAHDLAEFELEHEGLKLRVRKSNQGYAPLAASLPSPHPFPRSPRPRPTSTKRPSNWPS